MRRLCSPGRPRRRRGALELCGRGQQRPRRTRSAGRRSEASRREQIDGSAEQETTHALELALRRHRRPATPTTVDAEQDVTVITDISARLRGRLDAGTDGRRRDLSTPGSPP